MSSLFGRKIEVIAGAKKFSGDQFTIYFSVPFDDGSEPNIADVELYNLSSQSINGIKKGTSIIINAGYTGDIGVILTATAQEIKTDRSGVDHTTKIDAMDSNYKRLEIEINKTYKKNTTARQILNDLIPKTGLKVGALKLPVNKVYKGGKAVKGKLAEIIAEIARECLAKSHRTRGKVYIRPKHEGDKTGIILDKNRGLIGSPTQIEKEEKYKVTEKVKKNVKVKGKTVVKYENKIVEKTRIKKGWKVVCLLNHRITTDAIITVNSLTAKGVFRVESGKHEGKGDSFYSEMEVFPL